MGTTSYSRLASAAVPCTMVSRRLLAVPVGCALACLLGLTASDAQEQIRISGTVQWSGAGRMQVMSDAGGSVAVDLREAGQESYRGLRVGERVIVDGVVTTDRRRVVAHDIWRYGGDDAQSP